MRKDGISAAPEDLTMAWYESNLLFPLGFKVTFKVNFLIAILTSFYK